MSRPLAVVGFSLADVPAALRAVRAALDRSGPAILPRVPGAAPLSEASVPERVAPDVAIVVETSGSTGVPKRVALTADALLASQATGESVLGGPGQWILALAPHYVAGIQVLVRSIAAGTDPVVVSGRLDAVTLADAVGRMRADTRRYVALVPAQLATILDGGGAGTLARLDAVLVGGQRLPDALAERAAAAGVRVVRSYGSSETAGGCVYDGVPLPGVTMRVQGGEVHLGGAVLAHGYLGDPAMTDDRFVADENGERWYRTGDAGSIDAGVLSVDGRIDNVLVSGGVNVSLDRVEAAVRELDGLGDAVVVAAAHERWGQAPVVVTCGGAALADVRAYVGALLGPAARPDRIVRVREVPLLASGKPDRAAAAAIAAGGHGRPIA